MILCSVGEVIIFEYGCCISALEHVRMLILCSYVLLACMTKDQANPLNKEFTLLPSGRRYRVQYICTRTSRHKSTFVPTATLKYIYIYPLTLIIIYFSTCFKIN